jgi:hypothetical protein
MKTTLSSIAAALVLSSMSLAHAADTSVHIKAAPGSYHMMQEDFHDYKKSYQLTNGQVVEFSQRMAHYYTQLNHGDRVEIFPVAKGVFVTDAGTRFEFRDEAETIGISNFEKLPLAGNLPANTMMLARR